MSIANQRIEQDEEKGGIVFTVFCLWSIIMLCRPQDYIPLLAAVRPALLVSILMFAVMIIFPSGSGNPRFFEEKQNKYYFLLLLLMVASIPTALYPRLAFLAIFSKYALVVVYMYIFYKVVDSIWKLKRVLLLACLGSGAYWFVTLASSELSSGRISFGGMFDPNDMAYFALVFWPLNLLFLGRGNGLFVRLACLGAFCAGILIVLFSGSRGGFLSFGVALLFMVFRTRVLGFITKFFVVACCFVFLSVLSIDTERYATLMSLESDYNIESETGRLAIWKIGIRWMLANPFTGVGVRCFPNAVGLDRQERGLEVMRWQAAHNSAIQIGTETGIGGLFLFLLLSLNVLRIFSRVRSQSREGELVRIVELGSVGFVGMFTASMFLSQAYSIYWPMYLGFSAVANQLLKQERKTGSDE